MYKYRQMPLRPALQEAATICPRPCKLTFDLLTLKVVSESRVTWDTNFSLPGRVMWSETKKIGLGLVLHAVVLVLQVWCCVVKHNLVTLVLIMILEDTAAFQVLFIFSIPGYFVFGTSLLWRSTVAFSHLLTS